MTEDPASGRQKGERNLARLLAYFDGIAAAGRRLPERGGRVNVSAVAEACGFGRDVLYTSPTARAALEQAVARLGIGLPDQQRGEPPEPGAEAPDPRDRRIRQLEQHNASLKAENSSLRAERVVLRDRLRRLEHIEAHMVETGRRVAP